MESNLYSVLIEIYKDNVLVKSFSCPTFYMYDYVVHFMFAGSPYEVLVNFPDGVKHRFNPRTFTEFQLS
jgi:hypothetical protein